MIGVRIEKKGKTVDEELSQSDDSEGAAGFAQSRISTARRGSSASSSTLHDSADATRDRQTMGEKTSVPSSQDRLPPIPISENDFDFLRQPQRAHEHESEHGDASQYDSSRR